MRMRSRMDFPELHDGDVGVDLGGVEPGMAEQLLDEADVGPVLQHVGRAGVAEQVAGAGAPDGGGVNGASHPVADKAAGEALAVAAEEQRLAAGGRLQQGPGLLQVEPQPVEGASPHRDDAVFVALALAHDEQAPPAVEVGDIHPDDLTAPDPGGVEHLQDGAVA